MTASQARPAQPRRPADRARRSVHDRVRHLGRAQLPGRLRRGGRDRARRRTRRTTSSGSSRRTSKRSPTGTRHCTSGRSVASCSASSTSHLGDPVLRRPPEPRPPAPPRRVGQLAGVPGFSHRAPLRHGVAVRHHPGHGHRRTSRPTSRTGWSLADETLRAELAAAYPGRVAAHPGSPRVHGRRARHRPPPRRACRLSNLAGHLPPFLLRRRSRDDRGRAEPIVSCLLYRQHRHVEPAAASGPPHHEGLGERRRGPGLHVPPASS